MESEWEIGWEIRLKNLPGIPQCEECDLFNCLINLAVSIGEVLILSKFGILSNLFRNGGSSVSFGTLDLQAKNVIKISLFPFGHWWFDFFQLKGGWSKYIILHSF